jgi:hypothetical protein
MTSADYNGNILKTQVTKQIYFRVCDLKHTALLVHRRILCRRQIVGDEAEAYSKDVLFVGYLKTLYQLQWVYKVSENLHMISRCPRRD